MAIQPRLGSAEMKPGKYRLDITEIEEEQEQPADWGALLLLFLLVVGGCYAAG